MQRRLVPIFVAHLLGAIGAVYLIAFHLPLYADFSYLLPQDSPAVRDLRRLEERMVAGDNVLVVIEAPTAEVRAAAVTAFTAGVATISSDLVARVEGDELELREFLKRHRHLFVPLADLERARAALEQRIDTVKLKANPLYIDLEDPDPAAEAKERAKLDELGDQAGCKQKLPPEKSAP